MNPDKIVGLAVLAVGAVYLAGLIMLYPGSVFLERWINPLPSHFEVYFEIILAVFFCLLVFELYLKYKKLNNFALFLKKHWHEIIMASLVPFFAAFKILKPIPKIIKSLKASKNILKLFSKFTSKKN